ncbi:MAG: hypothetical protein AB1489_08550 [Acidobacteriota bacterium]
MTDKLVESSTQTKRTTLLAEKLRTAQAQQIYRRCRQVSPGNLSQPIYYTVEACSGIATTSYSQALLLPIGRTLMLERLLTSLSDAECTSLRLACSQEWLLAYLPIGNLPPVNGTIALRAVLTERCLLLLPSDLTFSPTLTDRELAAILPLQDCAIALLRYQWGEFLLWKIKEEELLSAVGIISAPFAVADQTPMPTMTTPFYGARMKTLQQPPLPKIGNILSVEQIEQGNSVTVGSLPTVSLWQRIKSFLKRLYAKSDHSLITQSQEQHKIPVAATTTPSRSWWRQLKQWLKGLAQRQQATDQSAFSHDLRRPTDNHRTPPWQGFFDRLLAKLTMNALLRVPGLARTIFGRQSEYLLKLMELMSQGKWEEAFRQAIPLGDEAESEKTSSTRISLGVPKPRRDLNFRLFELFSRSRGVSAMPVGEDTYTLLKRQYEQGVELLLAQKNYRAAAYVYAQLLRDYLRAAQVLASGGYHREAAVIYLEKLKDRRAAAQELAAAGDFERAAEIALAGGYFEIAAEYRRANGDEAGACECFELWVDELIRTSNLEQAARILEQELGQWQRAAELLVTIYQSKTGQARIAAGFQATSCLTRAGARAAVVELIGQMRCDLRNKELIGTPGSGSACATLLDYGQGLLRLDNEMRAAGLTPLDSVREAWRAGAEAAAGFVRTGLPTQAQRALTVLQQFADKRNDILLIADIERVATQLRLNPPVTITEREPTTSVLPRAGPVSASALVCTAHNTLIIARSDGCLERLTPPTGITSPQYQRFIVTLIGPYKYAAVSVATNTDGSRLAMLAPDGVVTVWSGQGDLLLELREPTAPYTALCPVIDNDELCLGNAKGGVYLVNLQSGHIIAQTDQEGIITTIVRCREMKLIACAGQQGIIQIYDSEKLTPLRSIPSEFGAVRVMAFQIRSTNRLVLAIGGERGELAQLCISTTRGIGTIERQRLLGHTHWINAVAFTHNGTLISAGYDKNIYLWENTAKPVILTGHKNEIVGLTYTPEGLLYSADTRGVIACWEISRGEMIESWTLTNR